MSSWTFYLNLGIRHITDFQGMDHMLFIAALVLPFTAKDIWAIIKLITAFTIGHTLSLIIAGLGIWEPSSLWVEFGIAASILLMAFMGATGAANKWRKMGVGLAGAIGLVHGLGFGAYYAFIAKGQEFWYAILPFTVGIELGQVIIVCALIVVYWLTQNVLRVPRRSMEVFFAGILVALSLQLVVERGVQILDDLAKEESATFWKSKNNL